MSSGHYIAYVNGGTSLEKEEWHGVSDARVWKCSREEALKAEAYVAFYRREGVQASAAASEEKAATSGSDGEEGDDGGEASSETGAEASGPRHPEFKVAEVVEMKVVKKKKGFFFVELDIGKGDNASVVTGLKNVSVGAKVVFAPEGSEAAARAAEASRDAVGQVGHGAICGPEDLGWKSGAAECVLLIDRCRVGGPAPAEEDDPTVIRRTPKKKAAADGSA
jgi:tRNA-binding EMAP/Myf-like protein